jgi:hypothetical protein
MVWMGCFGTRRISGVAKVRPGFGRAPFFQTSAVDIMKTRRRASAAELQTLQHESFDYFLKEVNPANGLIRDKTAENRPASIAATGLALACYPVAVERGFMTREAAAARTLATLRFFWTSPQGPESDATGHHGFYYHFLDMQTGRRAWKCELSTIDSAFLLAGALAAAAYLDADIADEREIRELADALYRRADWQWAQNQGATVTHGWKPEAGLLKCRWRGYDEALLLYILGLGSPTYPLPKSSYAAWTSSYRWESCYGYEYLYAGPLFAHQLSHVWVDFRGIQDPFMREKGSDYFENSRRATHVQQCYAIENPSKFEGYGEDCWGITASEGPGPATERNPANIRRLCRTRRALRTGRRHPGALGSRRIPSVCSRDRLACNRLLYPSGQIEGLQQVRLQGSLQSHSPGRARQSVRLVGITMALWT